MNKKYLESRPAEEGRRSKTDRRRVTHGYATIDKEAWPVPWKKEKEFIRKLMEKGAMKRKLKWKREDLYERKTAT